MKEPIHLLYTNDFHSYFEQWPKVVHYVENFRKKAKASKESILLIDIGDHIDRVHPITEATKAQANISLLNQLNYDIVTIGNNEGITLEEKSFYSLYDQATFKVVCSNLVSMHYQKPDWLLESHLLSTKHGTKILFFGLTAPFNDFYNLLGWHVEDPITVLEKFLNELNIHYDILILLSHLGLKMDKKIANRFQQIDLIIGGHTHHLLKKGKQINNTLLTAAGKNCVHIGEVFLLWDHERKELIEKKAHCIDLTKEKSDDNAILTIEKLNKEAKEKLNETVTILKEPYYNYWFKETELMKDLTETLRIWTKADCAMLNSGLLLENFPKGKITKGDIHRACPHPINPCVVELTGKQLLDVIQTARSKEIETFPLVGFGFRGKVLGRFSFSGLTIKQKNHYLTRNDIFIQNERLKENQTYRFATADTFTFGELFPHMHSLEEKKYFVPEFLRDLLIKLLQNRSNF